MSAATLRWTPAVKPEPCPWDLLNEHIRHIICRDNDEHFDYLMGWMARLVQFPAEQGLSLSPPAALKTGKSMLGRVLCRLFGQHVLAISNLEHLVGRFNSHLRDCLFLLGDEAFYASDQAHVRVLKALITEDSMAIEPKFRNLVSASNFLRIMLTSNASWVVSASLFARRFLVPNASAERIGDQSYFSSIWNQMESGRFAGILHDLLNRDISKLNPRMVPETEGLQDRKRYCSKPEEAWLLEVLHRGYVWRSQLGLEDLSSTGMKRPRWTCSTRAAANSPTAAATARPLHREGLRKFLRTMGGKAGHPRGIVTGEHIIDVIDPKTKHVRRKAQLVRNDRAHAFWLCDLATARSAFETATKLQIDWPPIPPALQTP